MVTFIFKLPDLIVYRRSSFNSDGATREKRSLVRIAYHELMFEKRGSPSSLLNPMEARILKLLKSKSRTEKKIARVLEVDPLVLSPVITDLILKGYLEIFRKRRLYFFSREFCTITFEGISALERAQTPFEEFLAMVRGRALQALESIAAESPVLKAAVTSARTIYRVAKAVA